MIQNPGFSVHIIENVPYILPHGQMIVDHKRGIQINETGLFLWNLLAQERSLEELLYLASCEYAISPDARADFDTEITCFLNQLCALHIILTPSEHNTCGYYSEQFYQIGGITLKLTGERQFFPQEFDEFRIPATSAIAQTISIYPFAPPIRENGMVVLRNEELLLLDTGDNYILILSKSKEIHEIHFSKTGDVVNAYCLQNLPDSKNSELFHALRLPYLYLAQKMGLLAIHSASLLYQEKAWLFSGRSGMGKSTHTMLWKELFNSTLLNGDLNLIGISNGTPMVYGIPWCGTSEISTADKYPLGGIILLNRSETDFVEELSSDSKQLLLAQRLISPTWDASLLQQGLDLIHSFANNILICRLCCTKNPNAVAIMKAYIDEHC